MHDPGLQDLMILGGCIGGACLGFLWFNAFPAEVFMGDTGSLGLGGAIAGMAILTRTEIFLLLIAGLFVLEALSVMAQVVSFKLFHRRVLLWRRCTTTSSSRRGRRPRSSCVSGSSASIFAGTGFALYYWSF